jgi:hypothetical protein
MSVQGPSLHRVLISARKACQFLADAGVSKRCALQVLASGLAGKAVDGGTTALYEHDRVLDLAQRQGMPWSGLAEQCPTGFFVSRREFPATGSREEQLAALSGGWASVSPWRWIAVSSQIDCHGSFPFVATIGGLVVLGADIVGVRSRSELVLERPGSWFEAIEGRWFPTGPGRPWVLHLGRLAPEKVGT